jgi:hypothetical protein
MKSILMTLAALLLAGCGDGIQIGPPHQAWEDAPTTYKCTDPESYKVARETKVCAETGFFDTYCYGAAIMRNCTKIPAGAK